MKRFFAIAALSATLLSLNSCTTINTIHKGRYEPVKSIVVDMDYDKAWGRVVDFFAELAVPIGVIDKESGIITSSETVLLSDKVAIENKYGHILPGMWFALPYNSRAWEGGAKCFFNIRLRKLDNEKVNVQVNFSNLVGSYVYPRYEQQQKYPSTCRCVSTGNFEKLLMEYLQQ